MANPACQGLLGRWDFDITPPSVKGGGAGFGNDGSRLLQTALFITFINSMPLKYFPRLSRIIGLLLVFFVQGIGAFSKVPEGYKLFNQSDGLAFNYVNDMVRDRDGYVWLGTEQGLFRFDGANFLHISEPGLETDDAVLKLVLEGGDLYVIYDNAGCSRLRLPDFSLTRITADRTVAVECPAPDRIYLLKADGKVEYFRQGIRIAQTILPRLEDEGDLNCFNGRLVASLTGSETFFLDTATLRPFSETLVMGINSKKQDIFATADTLFIVRDDTVFTIARDFKVRILPDLRRPQQIEHIRWYKQTGREALFIGNSNCLYRKKSRLPELIVEGISGNLEFRNYLQIDSSGYLIGTNQGARLAHRSTCSPSGIASEPHQVLYAFQVVPGSARRRGWH
ncbi:MAG: hypothetical protein RL021_1650, partial [Bacteroidota bacterium]